MKQRGFTMVEFLVVALIISLGAAIAMPKLGDSLARQDLDNAARRLAADILWYQQLWINAGTGPDMRSYTFTFSLARPYGYYITENGRIIKYVELPDTVQISGIPDPIGFSTQGVPLKGQTITLYSSKLKQTKQIRIEGAVGRVRII